MAESSVHDHGAGRSSRAAHNCSASSSDRVNQPSPKASPSTSPSRDAWAYCGLLMAGLLSMIAGIDTS